MPKNGSPSGRTTPSVSFVLFVHNEADILGGAVERCRRALERDFPDFEIVLVDDGSSDGTGDLMDALAQHDPRIVVLHNIVNLHIGMSIQRGLLAARKEFVVYDGVDLPLAPEDVRGLIDQMADCDVLLLDRTSFAGYTRWRWFTSQANRFLLRLVFRCRYHDLNYSQVFRRSIIRQILPIARSPGFTAPEMILRATRLGMRVRETEVAYHARPVRSGSLGKPHDLLWPLYELIRFRLTVWRKLRRSAAVPAPELRLAIEEPAPVAQSKASAS
jgi:dolichol-phosphate mannosyltransferase